MKTLVLLFVFLGFVGSAQALRVVHEQVLLDKLDDYPLCQSKDYSGDWCHDALVRWVAKHPNDSFKAGKLTRAAMKAWGAIPFFAKTVSSPKFDCKDEDVKLAVVSALNLPAESNKEVNAQMKQIAFGKCFPVLKAAIIEAANSDSYSFMNACKELDKKKALAVDKKKECDAQK